nr:tripartite tricarboxylate transporter substrate binding protein [Cupriavidus agavae]
MVGNSFTTSRAIPGRRRFLMQAGGGLAMAFAGPVLADRWPSRPIRFVTASSAGDPVDLQLREYQKSLAPSLGNVPMIVDNKAGAAGQIAAQSVLLAPPEGYDFLLASANFTITQSYFRRLPYRPMEDFTPVAMTGAAPIGLAIPASNPSRTLREWTAWAKRQKGALNYASLGNGTVPHLYGFQLTNDFGFEATHIPYKGAGAGLLDILRGQISFMMLDIVNLRPLLAKQQVRILAVTGDERSAHLPDVPTFREQGFNGYERTGWTGLLARRGTPPDIIRTLNHTMDKTSDTDQWRRKRAEVWSSWRPMSPEELQRQMQAEAEAWGALVRRVGVYGDWRAGSASALSRGRAQYRGTFHEYFHEAGRQRRVIAALAPQDAHAARPAQVRHVQAPQAPRGLRQCAAAHHRQQIGLADHGHQPFRRGIGLQGHVGRRQPGLREARVHDLPADHAGIRQQPRVGRQVREP